MIQLGHSFTHLLAGTFYPSSFRIKVFLQEKNQPSRRHVAHTQLLIKAVNSHQDIQIGVHSKFPHSYPVTKATIVAGG